MAAKAATQAWWRFDFDRDFRQFAWLGGRLRGHDEVGRVSLAPDIKR
jgi:hypothetical protein